MAGKEIPWTIERLEKYYIPEPMSGCWIWIGAKKSTGYGVTRWNGKKNALPHRIAYTLLCGPIPTGLTIDHLCRNRLCVNPSHMEAVTNKVNILRGNSFSAQNSRKTKCPRGHKYNRIGKKPDGTIGRICGTCQKEYSRALRQIARAALEGK